MSDSASPTFLAYDCLLMIVCMKIICTKTEPNCQLSTHIYNICFHFTFLPCHANRPSHLPRMIAQKQTQTNDYVSICKHINISFGDQFQMEAVITVWNGNLCNSVLHCDCVSRGWEKVINFTILLWCFIVDLFKMQTLWTTSLN